jgi:hypothetical protein
MFLTEKKVEEMIAAAITSHKETMVAEIVASVSEQMTSKGVIPSAETLETAIETAVSTAVDSRLSAVEGRMDKFEGAPGAGSADPIPSLDPTREDSLSALDQLNQFLATHRNDTAACVSAIAKFKQQS